MVQQAMGRRRWNIAGLLSVGVIVTYFDRTILSAAAPAIQHDFALDDIAMGFLLSAFGWTYAGLQVPVGLLLDRLGVRRVMVGSITLWTAASLLASMAVGLATMFTARLILGIAEAPTFPANAKATGHWFPRAERSLATALFDGAAKLSSAITIPVVALLVVEIGWRRVFVTAAALSLGYLLFFSRRYVEPSGDARLGDVERAHIESGGATAEGPADTPMLPLLSYLLHHRKVLGLALGHACHSYAFAFFVAWLPTYLARELDMDLLRSAGLAAVPWLCAAVADLSIGGWLIDRLVRRGVDETFVRKAVIMFGMISAMFAIGAAFTHDLYWELAWITISLCGLAAAAPASWSLPSLIAPTGSTATIGGVMNLTGSLAGVVAPPLTGLIVAKTHSFSGAFLLVGGVLALGIFFFVVVMGEVTPIADPPPDATIPASTKQSEISD